MLMCGFLGDGALKWGEEGGSRNQADNMGPDPIWLLSLQGRSNHDVEIKSMQSVEGQLWRTQVKVPSASQTEGPRPNQPRQHQV